MLEPNVSIYDMLIKHHRQQRTEDCPERQQEKQSKGKNPLNDRRCERDPVQRNARDSSNKRPKFRLSLSRTVAEDRPSAKMATNVVTATHLTRKRSTAVLKTNTNKDVLNHLVSKVPNINRKQPTRVAAGAASDVVGAGVVKKRQKMSSKVVSNSSNTSNLKPRQALSPSNPNRQSKKAKILKRVKSKSSNELKQQPRPKNPLGVAPTHHPANVLVKDAQSVDVQRYRL